MSLNIDQINEELKGKSPLEIVKWAIHFAVKPVITTNFRPYEAAILHVVTQAKKDINVIKMFESAADLARFLVKNHKKDSFSFFCGQQRRSEIETSLNQCKMDLDIHEVYKTTYSSKYFENCFDGILFFSPSAVSSYFIKNTWPESAHGFCIGSSTSKTLSKFTSNFSTAKNPTENQLLNIIHKYYVEK